MARQQYKVGMVVRIPLDAEQDTFAHVLRKPEVAVLNLFRARGDHPLMSEVEVAEVLFRVWVTNKAITSGRWQRVGMAPMRSELGLQVPRFKRDPITGQFSIYINGEERQATPAECVGLEPASVWGSEHLEARLCDYAAGRPHKPMKYLLEGVPPRSRRSSDAG